MATPPTFPDAQSLAEGIGTRSLPAVTTAAGDWLVVEIIAEANTVGETYPPTCPSLTLTNQTDSGTGASTDVHIFQYTAPDATGASRTVTITPSNATRKYRAQVTVVRGSGGPGTGKGANQTAQTQSVTRQGDNSAMFMAVGDFSTTNAIAAADWTPNGASISITDGTNADYAFGRWNDSGVAGTAAHGISTATMTLTTPACAVLEMLGTATVGGNEGPQTVPLMLPSLSYAVDDASMALSTVFPMRPWQRRFQWVTQPWLNSDDTVTVTAVNAPAEAASGTGSAPDAAVDLLVSAEAATGSGSALDAPAAVGVNAEAATGTGSAFDTTVSTAGTTNAPAELASGTGSAPAVQVALTANAEAATGTGTAPDPLAAVAVNAEAATGTGSALSANNPPFVVGIPTSTTGTGTTTTALAWDAGTVAGDLLTMWVSQIGQQPISSTSLGLTQQDRQVNSPTNNAALTVLTKVLDAGDISAGTVTATFGASQVYVVTLVTVRNHNGPDVLGTGSSGTATTTVAVNAITPGAPNTLILGGVGGRVATAATDVTWTWPGPLASLTQVNSGGAGNRAYLTLAQQTEVGPAVASGPDAPVPSSTIAYSSFRISIVPAGAGPVTSANAEAATGTGAANDAAADLQVNAEAATGTGSGPDAVAAVGVNAGAATGTGVANDATVTTAGSTNAPAEAATGTGSAPDASVALTVADAGASGTGSAPDAVAAVAVQPAAATGSGTASDPQAAIAVNDGGASGTGTALDATVSTASLTNAPAEVASGVGSAADAAVAIAVSAGASTGTGTAFDATVSTASLTNAPAEVASGTGTASDASVTVTVAAEVASGTGTALDPLGQTSRDAPAQAATGTGSAFDASITITVFAGAASGSGQALDAVGVLVLPFTIGVLTSTTSTSTLAATATALSALTAASTAAGLTSSTTPTATLVAASSTGGPT